MTGVDRKNASRETDNAEPIVEENKETRNERSEEKRRSRDDKTEN